jgi:CRP-like cAMP-binding protein
MKTKTSQSTQRPSNWLLQQLPERDYLMIKPHLTRGKATANQVVWHPGDIVESIFFPCGSTLVSLAISVDVGHEVHAVAIGNEGAVGFVDRGRLPAYARSTVLIGGDWMRLSLSKFDQGLRQSPVFRKLMAVYTNCLFAETLQAAACNAAHSNEQRTARSILTVMERTGYVVPLTHEQLAGMLGVRRSYASRLIENLKAKGILETRRGAILVRNKGGLQSRSCPCTAAIRSHFDEVFLG